MKEVWRDIYGFPYYQVSNLGRVRSFKWGKERILKPSKDRDGYLNIWLYKNCVRYTKQVHRLVAEAFIPNDDLFKTDINHKNEDKENNLCWINDDGSVDESKSNLEWCTHSYNCNYGTRNERMVETNRIVQRNDKTKSKIVFQYSLDGTFIKEFPSIMEVKRQLGFNQGIISNCCNGKRETHKGYIWRFKEE